MPSPLKKIRVMISSRNKDLIPDRNGATSLERIRKDLQNELQEELFCGNQILEVWINEEAGAADGSKDAWQHCMEQIEQADLVIIIYNGQAGWTQMPRTGVGICHAEFHHVWSLFPTKLRLIGLNFENNAKLNLHSPEEVSQRNSSNKRFKEEINAKRIFQDFATDAETLKSAVKLAVTNGVVDLTHSASQGGRGERNYLGDSLNWSRLNYPQRKEEIEKSVKAFFQGIKGSSSIGKNVAVELNEKKAFLRIHGIPAAFGVPEARELVGRPYLLDYKSPVIEEKDNLIGPIHILACHKKCTESQIAKFIGHPDLFVVQAPFGYFVADLTSFVQAFFLLECRDSISTRLSCQRLFDWMEQSGEIPLIIDRATSRAKIIQTIAKEISNYAKE